MRYFLLIIALAALGCRPQAADELIDFADVVADVEADSAAGKRPIRIAIGVLVGPRKTLEFHEAILWRVGEALDRPVELVQRKTYAESNMLLESRDVDLAFVCSGAYVEAQDRFGAELLAVPRLRGLTTYHSYIIARASGPVRRFADLEGRSFAFTDPMSNTGKLYPTFLLLESGKDPERFFGRIVYTGGHDRSIAAVADGRVDGAAVDHLVWEEMRRTDPQIVARTRVILKSPPFGMPPFIVHPALEDGLKEEMRRALLEMHDDRGGGALLRRAGIDRFVRLPPSAYDGIRKMRDSVAAAYRRR